MDIFLLFILLIVWIIYYGLKGIIILDKPYNKTILIITIIVELVALIIVSSLDSGILKISLIIYFTYSFSEYLFNNFFNKNKDKNKESIKFPNIPYMSKVEIINNTIHINYKLFKPIILIPLNIYLFFFKRESIIGLDDEFSVEINSKDGTKVDIKI